MSDVPLGAFLSGGVDSSAVVAFMAQAMHRPVKTFSVGFADAQFDERPFAREIAELYGTDHTELTIDSQVTAMLPRIAAQYDEPFGDSSAVPSYAIAELTRQHVTVVLNGDGADETFAGYDWYKMDRMIQRGEILPVRLRKGFAGLMRRLPKNGDRSKIFWKLYRLARSLELCRHHADTLNGPSTSDRGARQRLYSPAFQETVSGNRSGQFVCLFV